jgi:lysyl-tRNA synthetase class I
VEKHSNKIYDAREKDISEISEQKSYDQKLAEQKRQDALRDLENMRKWVDEDVPPPVKLSCKISKHIVSSESSEQKD